ncbi:hypothetical protein EV641_111101 [Rhodococcus sp. SMB37]|uniref:hypothetical protein n=1 Tax=Rhodococcus sp. SMB37 TaxID=2512213 RepID=UPI0006D0272C|nr:hypothetical protein [Rhodococcus sp. SMB37]TCN50825.1 hypothetical protein EV641_111101 [Rhodococcus sp. SMB37]
MKRSLFGLGRRRSERSQLDAMQRWIEVTDRSIEVNEALRRFLASRGVRLKERSDYRLIDASWSVADLKSLSEQCALATELRSESESIEARLDDVKAVESSQLESFVALSGVVRRALAEAERRARRAQF